MEEAPEHFPQSLLRKDDHIRNHKKGKIANTKLARKFPLSRRCFTSYYNFSNFLYKAFLHQYSIPNFFSFLFFLFCYLLVSEKLQATDNGTLPAYSMLLSYVAISSTSELNTKLGNVVVISRR